MPPPNRESTLPLSTITIGVKLAAVVNIFPLELPPPYFIHDFKATYSAAGSIVYTRVRPHDSRRWCGDYPAMLEMLQPGQFMVNGDCCCPSSAGLVVAQASAVLAGQIVFSYTPHDMSGAPVPDSIPLYLAAGVPAIGMAWCRPNRPGAFVIGDDAATAPLAIAVVKPGTAHPLTYCEQTVTLGDPAHYTGGADLQWTAPDATVYPITLTATGGGLYNLDVTADIPDVVVTRETNGFRFGFVGRWGGKTIAAITQVDNGIDNFSVHPADDRFVIDAALTQGAPAETLPALGSVVAISGWTDKATSNGTGRFDSTRRFTITDFGAYYDAFEASFTFKTG